jgi:predicted S18 family serine protease
MENHNKNKKNQKQKKYSLLLLIIIFISLIFFLLLGIFIGLSFSELNTSRSNSPSSFEIIDFGKNISNQSRMIVPAVDNQGEGSVGILKTTIREGSGLVLVNINSVLAGVNTQESARNAVHVASIYTNKSFENLDVIYNIEVNASVIEGPSAGTAMAASLISLIENKKLNPKVSITGGLSKDETIDIASGITQKAKALKEEGIELFLISEKTPLQKDYIRQKQCIEEEDKIYCEIRQTQKESLEISGLKLSRVSNLTDVMRYLYNEE